MRCLLPGSARRLRRGLSALLLLSLLFGCARPPAPADTGLVTPWLETWYALARAERLSPPVASRVFAYAAVALYEGMAPSLALHSLGGQLNGLVPLPVPDGVIDGAVAGLAAQATALKGLLVGGFESTPLAIDRLTDSLIALRTAAGVPEPIRARSVAHGGAIGRAILDWAATDGYAETRGRPYDPPTGRERWVNTTTVAEFRAQSGSSASEFILLGDPSGALSAATASERDLLLNRPKPSSGLVVGGVNPKLALEPHWGTLRPFVPAIDATDACQPPPPAAYSEAPGSPFWQEARAVYDASRVLTEEQRQTAFFWADNPGQTGTPPGHWLVILARTLSRDTVPLDQAVESTALMAVAMADAFIGCWDTKYRTMVVRPVTYIRRTMDPNWTTIVVTPPFPEYTSGHSVQSGAAAEVLTRLFGDQPVEDDAHVILGHPRRTYPTFLAAAEEAAVSRLYGGIHYPMAITHGVTQGRCIGTRVVTRLRTRPEHAE